MFKSTALVDVLTLDSHLSLIGATSYRGGSYTGDGTLHQVGDQITGKPFSHRT